MVYLHSTPILILVDGNNWSTSSKSKPCCRYSRFSQTYNLHTWKKEIKQQVNILPRETQTFEVSKSRFIFLVKTSKFRVKQ